MELFFIAVLCSAPLLALFVIIEITIAMLRYRRKQRSQGRFQGPWTQPPDQDL